MIVEYSSQDSIKRLDAHLSSLGLNYSIFSALPLDAQNKLLEGNNGLINAPSPLELLHVAGMLIIKQNGMVSFVYQTLSEAVIEWTLWRQLLPRWNPLCCHEEESFYYTLCEAQKTRSVKLDAILEPWLNKAVWDDGRNALIKIRAIRAENALQYAFYDEALKNLKDLQIRGCSGLVLDIIERNIETVTNEQVKRQLFSIKVDMVHLRGQYKEAADMIEKELAGLAGANIFVDEWLISQLIRLVHHQMFFSPVITLCEKIKQAIGKVDANIFPRVYGELLFMLGGNLGTLSGEYGESRSYLLKAIKKGKKCNDDYLVCRSLRKYSDFLRHRNHLMLASNVWQMAWELSEKYQGTRQGIYLLCTMGDLKRQMGNYDESGKYFQRSLELAKQSNIMGWVGHCYLGLAELSLELNDLPSADNYCQLAQNCYENIEQQWGKIQETEILFFKPPPGNDKVNIESSEEVEKWLNASLRVKRIDNFNNINAPKPNSICPAVAVALLNEMNEILLLKRRDSNKWTMAGGTLDFGESLLDCAIREVKEETGYDIEISGLIGTYSNPNVLIEYSDGEVRQEFTLVYSGKIVGGNLNIDDESKEVCWIPINELCDLEFAESQKTRIKDVSCYIYENKIYLR